MERPKVPPLGRRTYVRNAPQAVETAWLGIDKLVAGKVRNDAGTLSKNDGLELVVRIQKRNDFI